MADKKLIIDQILLKRGNSSQWASTSYILENGELGWDTEAKILKVGNGESSWGDLTCVGAEGDEVTIVKDGNVLTIKGFDSAEAGAQLRKTSDGKLEWFVPSTKDVEDLQEAVGVLQTDLDNAEIAISANTDSIAAINTKIGTVPEGKDVVTMISEAQTAATYDDTALQGRVKAIEDDYLKASDKTTLENSIKTNADAIDVLNGDETEDGSVKKTVVDEIAKVVASAPEDFDTLKEIADWIANDQTGAASLTNRIANIENTYLTETEINDLISEIELYIGTIPETSTSENVIAYIQEVIDALKIGDYAKASDLTTHINNTTAHITAEERNAWNAKAEVATTLAGYGIADAYTKEETENAIDAKVNVVDGKITTLTGTVSTHTQDEVVHITAEERSAWNAKAEVATTLEGYGITDAYTKEEVNSEITTKVGEVNSTVGSLTDTVNGHIDNDDIHVTLDEKNIWNGLPSALAKKVAGVKVAGTALTADSDGNIDIPIATSDNYGVVKSSADEGKVSIGADGTMTVNSLNVNNLVQTDGDILILDCGVIE